MLSQQYAPQKHWHVPRKDPQSEPKVRPGPSWASLEVKSILHFYRSEPRGETADYCINFFFLPLNLKLAFGMCCWKILNPSNYDLATFY